MITYLLFGFLLQLVSRETQGEFRKTFRLYFKLISTHLQSERRSMNEREKRNLQILQNKGELSEERRTGNENAQKAYDKLLTNTNALAVSVTIIKTITSTKVWLTILRCRKILRDFC